MSTLHAAFLGFIQGITEFLPVSSSAHLVIFQNLLGLKEPEVAFDVALHFGTLFAVLIYYFNDLIAITTQVFRGLFAALKGSRLDQIFRSNPDFRLGISVVIATIPTAFIGFVFNEQFGRMFGSLRDTAIQLIFNAGILWLSVIPYRKLKGASGKSVGFWTSIWIGIAQGIAIIPGISRSTMTIVTALFLGVGLEESVKFSFLLSIVSILGAGVLELRHGVPSTTFSSLDVLLGSTVSLAVGYLSIAWLLRAVRSGKLYQFANYCLVVGILGLVFHYFFHV